MDKLCVVVFLIMNTWKDMRKREISPAAALMFGVGGTVFGLLGGKSIWEMGGAMLVGGMVLALGVLSKGAIGLGDGVVIMALGTVVPALELLGVLLAALLICAVYSGFLMLWKRKGRDVQVPFMPFLLMGYLGGLLI